MNSSKKVCKTLKFCLNLSNIINNDINNQFRSLFLSNYWNSFNVINSHLFQERKNNILRINDGSYNHIGFHCSCQPYKNNARGYSKPMKKIGPYYKLNKLSKNHEIKEVHQQKEKQTRPHFIFVHFLFLLLH